MTERLYWADAYLREFEARVLEVRALGERWGVVLDRTAFYPTSGGQLHDTGLLADQMVEDVAEEDGIVLHFVRGRVKEGAKVRGTVDWGRRFDFMQQHTAFHLLAQAFLRITGAHTLSSHLGEEASTLELNTAEVSAEALSEVEKLANTVVWENRPVRTFVVQPEEAQKLALRKPPKVEGPVRIVEIEGFDLDPCSGTHVASTGQVGLIKVTGKEKLRGHLRFRFLAGARAWRDYTFRLETLEQVCTELTTGAEEAVVAVQKLRTQCQSAAKQLRGIQERLLEAIKARVLAGLGQSGCLVVDDLNGIEWPLVRKLAFQLLESGAEAVLMVQSLPEIHVAVGTNRKGVDLRGVLAELSATLGGKGGGRPDFVELVGGNLGHLDRAVALVKNEVDRLLRLSGSIAGNE